MHFTQCNPHYLSNTAQSTTLNSLNPIHPLNLNHPTQLTQPNPTYTPHIPNPAHQTHSPISHIQVIHPTQLTQPNSPNPTHPTQLTKLHSTNPTNLILCISIICVSRRFCPTLMGQKLSYKPRINNSTWTHPFSFMFQKRRSYMSLLISHLDISTLKTFKI